MCVSMCVCVCARAFFSLDCRRLFVLFFFLEREGRRGVHPPLLPVSLLVTLVASSANLVSPSPSGRWSASKNFCLVCFRSSPAPFLCPTNEGRHRHQHIVTQRVLQWSWRKHFGNFALTKLMMVTYVCKQSWKENFFFWQQGKEDFEGWLLNFSCFYVFFNGCFKYPFWFKSLKKKVKIQLLAKKFNWCTFSIMYTFLCISY